MQTPSYTNPTFRTSQRINAPWAVVFYFLLLTAVLNQALGQEMVAKAKSTSGSIPFEKTTDNRIALRATYRDVSFPMVLDSYALFSGLPEAWVKNWKLPKTPYIYTTRDFQNKRKKERLRLLDSLRIAGQFEASNFYVNPKKILNTFEVGYLGTDFLNDYNWKINFGEGTLHFDESPFRAREGDIRNTFGQNEFPWFEVSIGNASQKTTVDLGAYTALSFPVQSRIGAYLLKKYNPSPQVVTTGGANGLNVTDTQYTILLDSILIQGKRFENVPVRLSQNTRVSFIGCQFFERGTLLLNYKNDQKGEREVAFGVLDE